MKIKVWRSRMTILLNFPQQKIQFLILIKCTLPREKPVYTPTDGYSRQSNQLKQLQNTSDVTRVQFRPHLFQLILHVSSVRVSQWHNTVIQRVPGAAAWPRPAGPSSKSNTRYSSVDRKYRIFPKMIKRTKRRLKNMHQSPSSFWPLSTTPTSPRIKCSVSPLHLSEMFQDCSIKVRAPEMNAIFLPQPSFH